MSNQGLENAYAYAAEMQSKSALSKLPRYVRREELRQIVPLADTTVYEMEKRGEFPKRIYLTARAPAWSLAEVEAWIEQRRQDTASGKMKPSVAVDVRKRKRRPVRHVEV